MKRTFLLWLSSAMLLPLWLSTSFVGKENPEKPVETKPSIQWLSFEEAVLLNKTQPKKIFIDVYTDWCGWCKVMDKNTFTDPKVIAYMNTYYHAVKFDGEQRADVTFQGNVFKFIARGNKGYHELAASLLGGKLSYPTVVFLDDQFRMIQPLPGYQKPENLLPVLMFFGEDYHTRMSWEDFQKEYPQLQAR